MFSKDSEKSNRNGGLEIASASFTELQHNANILFVSRSKALQKNMKL